MISQSLFASATVDLQFKVGSEPPDAEKHRKIHWGLAGKNERLVD